MSEEKTTGAQRAAAFLLGLPREDAAEVIKHLGDNVIVEVVEAMGTLDDDMTSSEAMQSLQKELIRSLRLSPGARVRSQEELHSMLSQTLGKAQAEEVFEKISQRLLHERPFISIESAPPANIAKVLIDESDAVAALVLAHVDPSVSAGVLGAFPPERSLGVVKRMAKLIPPGFHTLVSIANDLAERLKVVANMPVAVEPSTRLRSIAEVLNFSEPDIEKSVLEGIDADDSDMASEIREFMFTWEDLSSIDKRAMQKILATVETRTLAIALKASSKPVEDNIMGNLSQRVREMVADERDLAGKMPLTEVEAARAEVMKSVRGLMEAGEFQPARAGEDLVS